MAAQNPVGWFEIYVTDMDRAQKFYETVLDVKLTELPNPDGTSGKMLAFHGEYTNPGTSGALVKDEIGEPSAKGTLIYFVCDDCATELARVEAAGGKIITPKMDIGDFGFCGVVADTEGNSIGLHSMQ
jgi:predicted enzyme related to lactoylglutathione lyase